MFIAKSDAVVQVQNKVQEVAVKKSDNQVVSTSGSTATVNIGEQIAEARCALRVTSSAVEVASTEIVDKDGNPVDPEVNPEDGVQIKCTLSAAMTDDDCLIVKYVVQE